MSDMDHSRHARMSVRELGATCDPCRIYKIAWMAGRPEESHEGRNGRRLAAIHELSDETLEQARKSGPPWGRKAPEYASWRCAECGYPRPLYRARAGDEYHPAVCPDHPESDVLSFTQGQGRMLTTMDQWHRSLGSTIEEIRAAFPVNMVALWESWGHLLPERADWYPAVEAASRKGLYG